MDLSEERFNLVLRLKDGRRVSVAEAGDPNGVPVFMLYGLGCSRFFVAYYDRIGKELGLRLICPDRPGRGRSEKCRDRTFMSYAEDILQIADLLGVYYFALWGYSAGGAHALGCVMSKAVRSRLIGRVVIVGCWVPTDTPDAKSLHRLASSLPRVLLSAVASLIPVSTTASDVALQSFRAGAADLDQSDQELSTIHRRMMEEAVRNGSSGYADEVVLCCSPSDRFGFRYGDVQHCIRMYHGRSDTVVPLKAARLVAKQFESCKYYEIEDVTHQTIIARSMVEGTFLHLLEDIQSNFNVPDRTFTRSNTIDKIIKASSQSILETQP